MLLVHDTGTYVDNRGWRERHNELYRGDGSSKRLLKTAIGDFADESGVPL
jgi:hypothetical protein